MHRDFFSSQVPCFWPTSKINWLPPQLSWNLLGTVVWGGWRSAMDTIIHMYESWILHDLCSSAPSACLTVHTVNYKDVAAPGDCWWRSPEVIGQNRAVSNSYSSSLSSTRVAGKQRWSGVKVRCAIWAGLKPLPAAGCCFTPPLVLSPVPLKPPQPLLLLLLLLSEGFLMTNLSGLASLPISHCGIQLPAHPLMNIPGSKDGGRQGWRRMKKKKLTSTPEPHISGVHTTRVAPSRLFSPRFAPSF